MMRLRTLKSKEDESVNFVLSGEFPGLFEARYVRRNADVIALYLSSQSGCRQACRMCHLTASKQTALIDATLGDYQEQAQKVFEWYDTQPKAKEIHYNFMARGEAMANPLFLDSAPKLFRYLEDEGNTKRGLGIRIHISTIMPKVLSGKSLRKIFPSFPPQLYYSIYSMNPDFRKKWLPNAMPPDEALEMLKEYYRQSRVSPKLHWAFIEGENDRFEDIYEICEAVKKKQFPVNFAIVRYNPYSENYGHESSEEIINRNAKFIKDLMPMSEVKIVTRVGHDIKASCGMFVE